MSCSCKTCVLNCKVLPGYLIPADLDRMVPPGVDPFDWAEVNLVASPGAIVKESSGKISRIPTLCPATKPDGSCINLTSDDRCSIHANAPFGCAFFHCKMTKQESDRLSKRGLIEICLAGPNSLYLRIWRRLNRLGKTCPGPEVRRKGFKI
jgi:hypothetical protein